jgi:ankyrin repeat protein
LDNALYIASLQGHGAVVKMLLDAGADMNAQGAKYGNALQAAARFNEEEVVEILLDAGADVRVQGGKYGNALQAASVSPNSREAVVKMLLDAGADVNVRSGYYGNTFHAAAFSGHLEVLNLLMSKHSTIPLHDHHGRSLLWWAAAGGDKATVDALVSNYKFDPQKPNNYGQTPLWIASKRGHVAVSKFLSAKCGVTDIQLPLSPKSDEEQDSGLCHVCTSYIKEEEIYFKCSECTRGNRHVCANCKERGAYCEDVTHVLVERAMVLPERV